MVDTFICVYFPIRFFLSASLFFEVLFPSVKLITGCRSLFVLEDIDDSQLWGIKRGEKEIQVVEEGEKQMSYYVV